MRRRLGLVTITVWLAVTGSVVTAATASAAPPEGHQDCRFPSDCHPGLHLGGNNGRNVGG